MQRIETMQSRVDQMIIWTHAGAVFVLESKENWLHVDHQVTMSIVSPTLLSFPLAFTALEWFAGIVCFIVGSVIWHRQRKSSNMINRTCLHIR